MQYAVYPHAWHTQGASVLSVCVTRQEEKKGGQQRKQIHVTPDRPSASGAIISPSEGLDGIAADGLGACLYD